MNLCISHHITSIPHPSTKRKENGMLLVLVVVYHCLFIAFYFLLFIYSSFRAPKTHTRFGTRSFLSFHSPCLCLLSFFLLSRGLLNNYLLLFIIVVSIIIAFVFLSIRDLVKNHRTTCIDKRLFFGQQDKHKT